MFVESHDAELRELDSIWAKGALLICVWEHTRGTGGLGRLV